MDHKEREGKANLAPVREFLRRVFSNMGRIREGRNEFAAKCESGLAFAPWRRLNPLAVSPSKALRVPGASTVSSGEDVAKPVK
jgi:hypothetical protein